MKKYAVLAESSRKNEVETKFKTGKAVEEENWKSGSFSSVTEDSYQSIFCITSQL